MSLEYILNPHGHLFNKHLLSYYCVSSIVLDARENPHKSGPSYNLCSSWGRQINNKIHRVPKALWAMEKNKAIKGRIENKGKDVMREHWQERGKDGPL